MTTFPQNVVRWEMISFTSLPQLFGLQYIVFNVPEQFSDFNQQFCRLKNINHWVVFAIKVHKNTILLQSIAISTHAVAIQFEKLKLMQI